MNKAPVIGIVENEEKYRVELVNELQSLEMFSSIQTWPSAEEYLHDKKNSVDVILLDIKLNYMPGDILAREISILHPHTKIIMLSNLQSEETIFSAIKNGAIGYVHKSDLNDLKQILEIVLNGGAIISPTIALRIMNNFQQREVSESFTLTEKEDQILKEVVTGKKVDIIASTLDVSINTIRFHMRNIYKKLQVKNRTELLLKAKKMGFL